LAELEIAPDDRRLLLNAAVDAVHNQQQLEWVLDDIGLPRRAWPEGWRGAESAWRSVFAEFDAGAIEAGYSKLIEVLLERYPASTAFAALHRRYPVPSAGVAAGSSAAGESSPAGTDLAGLVFVSYVREDSARVDRLQRGFEAAGIRVWRATANLLPGENWRTKIRSAISDDALVFLACFSKASVTREKSYQNEELSLAIEQMRQRNPGRPWLIPVRFEDCVVPDLEIGLGRYLSSIHTADLIDDRFDEGLAKLVTQVARILGR
jgi:hypothetical protein